MGGWTGFALEEVLMRLMAVLVHLFVIPWVIIQTKLLNSNPGKIPKMESTSAFRTLHVAVARRARTWRAMLRLKVATGGGILVCTSVCT